MDKTLLFAVVTVLTLALVVAGVLFGFVETDPNVVTVVYPAFCPDGTITQVIVPVDCLETCGVELAAEATVAQ